MDKKEFEKHLAEFDATIIKLAKTYHIEPLEWQDVAQELRITLWLKRDQFLAAKNPLGWAYKVCRNKIVDLARHHQSQKFGEAKKISLEELKEQGIEF